MSSTTIPKFKELSSDALYNCYVNLRQGHDGWYYEHDEHKKIREKIKRGYMLIIFLIPFLSFPIIPILGIHLPLTLKVMLILAIIALYIFFARRYIVKQQTKLRKIQGFGSLKLSLAEPSYYLGDTVQCSLKQLKAPHARLTTTRIFAQLSCYEITHITQGTTERYEHVLLRKSILQSKNMQEMNGQLRAEFALTLPQQAYPSLELPNIKQQEYRRTPENPSIWWIVEFYQPALDIHTCVPLEVKPN